MEFTGVYHKTSEQMSYPYNENQLIVNIKTGYDVKRVFIHYGDPFDAGILGGKEKWTGKREEICYKKRLKHQLWWTTTLVPQYKRCKYYFELQTDKETWYYFEDGFLTEEQLHMLAVFANGDARTALNTLDMVVLNGESSEAGIVITKEVLEQCTSQKSLLYDRQGEEHYNLISALHKSMRNSDVDAAIYWLARMLEAGEDPLYVARRLVRFASEDIGMADSRALEICVAVYQACHFLGMPECNVHLTHAVTYLSLSPKSNALYMAYGAAKEDAVHMLSEPVPLQIRNAPTSLMKDLHYGEGYQYAHDTQEKLTNMECMPESLKGREYYHPTIQGSEARVSKRLQDIKEWKRKHQNK